MFGINDNSHRNLSENWNRKRFPFTHRVCPALTHVVHHELIIWHHIVNYDVHVRVLHLKNHKFHSFIRTQLDFLHFVNKIFSQLWICSTVYMIAFTNRQMFAFRIYRVTQFRNDGNVPLRICQKK